MLIVAKRAGRTDWALVRAIGKPMGQGEVTANLFHGA
jgi:hypothetical protein